MAFEKEARFTGRRALLAERAGGGPARRLVGLELDWSAIEAMYARHGLAPRSPYVHRDQVPVYREGLQVGRATSVTWGPTIKKMVGFGSVDRGLTDPGTRVSVEWTVEGERGKVGATVVPMPFLDLERNVPGSPRAPSDPSHRLRETGPVTSRRLPVVLGLVLLAGLVGLAVGLAGSALLGAIAGLVCLAVALAAVASAQRLSAPADPGRRRLLVMAGLGTAAAVGGAAVGRVVRRVTRPDPRPIQTAMAEDLGTEYMELVARAYHPDRSGDPQLLVAPFNSANYPQESVSLVPEDPGRATPACGCTSSASRSWSTAPPSRRRTRRTASPWPTSRRPSRS